MYNGCIQEEYIQYNIILDLQKHACKNNLQSRKYFKASITKIDKQLPIYVIHFITKQRTLLIYRYIDR